MALNLLQRWGQKVFLLLILSNVGFALVPPLSNSLDYPFASLRFATRESEGDGCLDYLCTITTCGSSSCDIGPLRRSGCHDGSSDQPLRHQVWNDTSFSYAGVSRAELDKLLRGGSLTKRVFKTDDKGWGARELDEYLPKLVEGEDSDFKGRYFDLIEDKKENTVSGEFVFRGEEEFTVGTGGLHGCTIVTIVSNRAVHIGHYWEVSAMGGKVDDFDPVTFLPTDPRGINFQKRVLNAIVGGERDPETAGDPFNPWLYNRATDQTRVIITSPSVWDWRGPTVDGIGPETWLYRNRIDQIIDAILGKFVANKPKVVVLPYKRLLWSMDRNGEPVGQDAHLVDKTARGSAFFQYSGEYKGSYWRLFYEYTIYRMGDEQWIGEHQPGPE
ncbi:uncharacterized protein B0H64DRAFT_375071 [Chaetomium fimeti]|uniref:Uncharacterized protein n=1 Tax=Chaetomium fimeti TaxID=1854472 RepID=A0AAE0HCZ9_9PEZI|nr:hypothetical protein B0H64DRAFT_375071 [Chaetomium fimeti]